jgi:hypothetical protein
MRPVETIPGIGGGGIEESDGGKREAWRGEFNYNILLRTFVNVTRYSQYSNNKNI